MPKKQIKNTFITTVLIVILGVVLGATAHNMFRYYTGPDYVVHTYLKCLKERKYDKLVTLLNQESLEKISTKNEIITYYQRTYEQNNKLMDVKASKGMGQVYGVKYSFKDSTQQSTLSVTQNKGKWYIEFPFKACDVEIFAPYGAKVYLDSMEVKYSTHKSYQMKNVLPGTYLLKVEPAQESYAPYYKMLQIPQEKSYIVPYDLAHVTINVVPKLKVELSPFSQVSDQYKIEFEDILLGKYQISVQDLEGYLTRQEAEVELQKGENIFTLKDFKLSDKGEKKLQTFLRDFYKDYLEGIQTHHSEAIATYFSEINRSQQLGIYESWYIDKKNVSEATMAIQLGECTIDEQGILHTEITENVELSHKPEGSNAIEHYKVIIRWQTNMSILNEEWQIVDREIEESIVAVKDQDGQWIQY